MNFPRRARLSRPLTDPYCFASCNCVLCTSCIDRWEWPGHFVISRGASFISHSHSHSLYLPFLSQEAAAAKQLSQVEGQQSQPQPQPPSQSQTQTQTQPSVQSQSQTPTPVQSQSQSQSQTQTQQAQPASESTDPAAGSTHVSFRLVIQSSQCGSLIGKGGSKIKEIREVSCTWEKRKSVSVSVNKLGSFFHVGSRCLD